ncbi:hypothetical protein Fot_21941 [Forsythia ovata]|uniref:Uncharacterized protein n=1 Tax=Forsythia ovata TaxID=205694 RepID=A0ABD1UXZ0_9LAMI
MTDKRSTTCSSTPHQIDQHHYERVYHWRPHIGGANNYSQKNYVRVVKKPLLESYWVCKKSRPNGPSIIFGDEDDANVHYLHYDALVVQVVIARNIVKRKLGECLVWKCLQPDGG